MRSCLSACTYPGSTEDEKKPVDFHNCRGAAADRLPGGLCGPAAGGVVRNHGADRAAAHSDANAGTHPFAQAHPAAQGDADAHPFAQTHAFANNVAHGRAESDAFAYSYPFAYTGTDTQPYAHANTEAHTYPFAHTGTNAGAYGHALPGVDVRAYARLHPLHDPGPHPGAHTNTHSGA